jgi:hypothetical protein
MTPIEHDQHLINLWDQIAKAQRTVQRAEATVQRLNHLEPTHPTAMMIATDLATGRALLRTTLEELNRHEAQYTGWSRFWLVVSSAHGHLHRTTSCSTCLPTTRFSLIAELSGTGESEAVESQGSILCSVCFPTAPVEWTTGEAKVAIAARAEREAKRAEREAKRLEKALLPDGSPLKIDLGNGRLERFDTLASAKMWLTSFYSWAPHSSYPESARDLVAQAVAAKTGESVADVLAAAEKRAGKRGW